MNYKGFKKVSEDDAKAVLKNQMGHTITISKKSLSPQHAAELKKLPLHQAEPDSEVGDTSMGGEQKEAPAQPTAGGVNIFVGGGGQSMAPQEVAPTQQGLPPSQPAQPQSQQRAPAQTIPEAGDNDQPMTDAQRANRVKSVRDRRLAAISQTPQPQQPQSDVPDTTENAAAAPQNMVQQAQQETQGSPQENLPKQKKQEFLQESQDWHQDLASGHITPQTYSSLFAKKDTLGKIGTLFGLLVGGAGSGLTGQPNPVLKMMHDELMNDLEAQKQSKSNAQNFLRMNQAHQLQQAQIGRIGAETALTKTEVDTKAYLLTQMQHNAVALHKIVDWTSKLPPGDYKNKALAALGTMQNAVSAGNYDLADKYAVASSFMNSQGGRGNIPTSPGGVDNNKINQLRLQSQQGVPGAPSPSEMAKMNEEATKLGDAGILKNDFMSAYDNLSKRTLAGAFDPNVKKALTTALIARAAKIGEGRYTESAARSYDSMLPVKSDLLPSTVAEKRRIAERFFTDLGGSAPTLHQFGAIAGPQEGATGTHKGNPVIFTNGRWQPRQYQ